MLRGTDEAEEKTEIRDRWRRRHDGGAGGGKNNKKLEKDLWTPSQYHQNISVLIKYVMITMMYNFN